MVTLPSPASRHASCAHESGAKCRHIVRCCVPPYIPHVLFFLLIDLGYRAESVALWCCSSQTASNHGILRPIVLHHVFLPSYRFVPAFVSAYLHTCILSPTPPPCAPRTPLHTRLTCHCHLPYNTRALSHTPQIPGTFPADAPLVCYYTPHHTSTSHLQLLLLLPQPHSPKPSGKRGTDVVENPTDLLDCPACGSELTDGRCLECEQDPEIRYIRKAQQHDPGKHVGGKTRVGVDVEDDVMGSGGRGKGRRSKGGGWTKQVRGVAWFVLRIFLGSS